MRSTACDESPGRRASARLTPLAFTLAALATACAGASGGPSGPAPDADAVELELHVRDLLEEQDAERVDVVVDGAPLRLDPAATLTLQPGRHALFVRDARFRPDLAVLRFDGEDDPRAQMVGVSRLEFEVRAGDRSAELALVRRDLDVRFFVSLLDGGVSRRWRGPVNLHVDRSPTPAGWSLSDERLAELVAFADSALMELTAGALRVGEITSGTGLTWEDFLDRERAGTITIHTGVLGSGAPQAEVSGWGFYREGAAGVIRSGNVFVSDAVLRREGAWRGALGHELGHALSLQHPRPCLRWSRMSGGQTCTRPIAEDVVPGGFWGAADRDAGRVLYGFRPGTDFGRLADVPG